VLFERAEILVPEPVNFTCQNPTKEGIACHSVKLLKKQDGTGTQSLFAESDDLIPAPQLITRMLKSPGLIRVRCQLTMEFIKAEDMRRTVLC